MKTPYVKISTVRKFGNWDTILGYRPILVYENRNGNNQSIWMIKSIFDTPSTFDTPEQAQAAYDLADTMTFPPFKLPPVQSTDHVDEINEKGLFRDV